MRPNALNSGGERCGTAGQSGILKCVKIMPIGLKYAKFSDGSGKYPPRSLAFRILCPFQKNASCYFFLRRLGDFGCVA